MAIITRSYKSGSIVYMEGDKSENIYILKGGRVILTTKKVEDKTWIEEKVNVKPGEFFGVKSALGRYPRDETAQTVGDTLVLVLTLADFERMILQNLNVVKKMLRVFSNQLRRIGKTVREVLGEGESINPEVELFKLGEYYYKVEKVDQALHAYKKYLEYYPDSKYASTAKDRINRIKSGNMGGGDDFTPTFDAAPARSAVESSEDFTDFSIDEQPEPAPAAAAEQSAPAARSPLAGEMDDFLSDNKADSGSDDLLDDFSFDEPQAGGGGAASAPKDINEMFYEAMRLFSAGQYDEASKLYDRIINMKSLQNEAERKTYEKAHFEMGRCQYKQGMHREALGTLSAMIKKFPNSDMIKSALLYIGMVFEDIKNYEKAMTYYSKVAAMEPRDQTNKDAQNRLNKIQNSQGKR
ncbi:MAG: tetratricopeptide repeat protein [Spirochaetes bacterium]|nr:tetratricopeptide repeat protein [Spirochaetota bacterium]HPA72405.1 tetratricopeptide repeat protein [Spirochaetota bacterium]